MSSEHWFEYHGERLPMYYHMYNLTHLNERAVELSIAKRWRERIWEEQRDGWTKGVEVGNVMGHYELQTHLVVDRDERPAWYQEDHQHVANADLFEWAPPAAGRYPWVLSISTIEHTYDPLKALYLLKSLVAPGGRLLVTHPTGASDQLDLALESNPAGPSWATRYCTISRAENDHGGWEQDETPRAQSYGPWANTVAVIEWERPA